MRMPQHWAWGRALHGGGPCVGVQRPGACSRHAWPHSTNGACERVRQFAGSALRPRPARGHYPYGPHVGVRYWCVFPVGTSDHTRPLRAPCAAAPQRRARQPRPVPVSSGMKEGGGGQGGGGGRAGGRGRSACRTGHSLPPFLCHCICHRQSKTAAALAPRSSLLQPLSADARRGCCTAPKPHAATSRRARTTSLTTRRLTCAPRPAACSSPATPRPTPTSG